MRNVFSAMRQAGLAAMAILLVWGSSVMAQQDGGQQDSFLLTIFLRHDQSKNLDQINAQLRQQDFYKKFPPPGIEIVSWYVMMGIGQVVTLRVPAGRLREVNRSVEQSAWGAFRTEFFPTYDLKGVMEEERKKNQ